MTNERTPGSAWCSTEGKPAVRSCGADGHDTGPLDTQGKRTAFLLATTVPGESVQDIVAALDEGARTEQETAQ
jgi:hypothetical protein